MKQQPIIAYAGRVVSLAPAELGVLFEDLCTVKLVKFERPSTENGWKKERQIDPQREFWYAADPSDGARVFCTHAGYGPTIERQLRDRGFTVEVRDLVDNGLGEPDFSQIGTAAFRGSQATVLAAILAERGGVVDCPTGWGKSYLIRMLARLYPKASIVITEPNIDIARELYEGLREYGDVGMVGGGKRDPRRVTVAVINSIKHCARNCNLLLVDEAHTAAAPVHRNALVQFPRAKLVGFTASTEGRHDSGDGYLDALFGPVIARVPYSEAVANGNVVPISVFTLDVTGGPDVSKIENDVRKNRLGIWDNAVRNQRVVEAVSFAAGYSTRHEHDPDPQILIMVEKVEHVYRLAKLLPGFVTVHGEVDIDRVEKLTEMGVLTKDQPVCTSRDRKRIKEEFAAGKIRRVIANYVWSKGVNFLDLGWLIRADGTASKIHSVQVPGRLSRLGSDGAKKRGYLIDFIDRFSPDLERRSKSRLAIYRRNGFTIARADAA